MNKFKVLNTGIMLLFVAAIPGVLTSTSAIAAKPDPVASATCPDVQTTAFCNDELADLCAAIESAGSLKQRNIDGMISKVVGASIKMNQYKGSEAEDKLGQVGTKVDTLATAAKPKISDDDANAISPRVDVAVTCVIVNY